VAPHVGLAGQLLVDSFITAVVSYATLMSMALILARGENYEVDANQELLALVSSIDPSLLVATMPYGLISILELCLSF
jgi:MFS superfamily sulfate permease-like transporter